MTRRRLSALGAVWTLPTIVFVGATLEVQHHFAMPAAGDVRLGDDARADVVRVLRAALTDAPPASTKSAELERGLAGPVIVTVWSGGAPAGRVNGRGDTIAAAVTDAARAIRADAHLAHLPPADAAAARIQVDVVTARAPLGDGDPLFAIVQIPGLSAELADAAPLAPGLDGVGAVDTRGVESFLAPGDLVADKLVAKPEPVPALPDLAAGLDRKELAKMFGVDRGWFRFRADTFVERPLATRADGPPLPLTHGTPPGPPPTAANLRAAAAAGARYLVAHLAPSGRYVYEQELTTGKRTDPDRGAYSIPRHAGATYFLAQVYRATRDPSLLEPIQRAARHLETLVASGGCNVDVGGQPASCVFDPKSDRERASLGSSALTVVALVEYEQATGDARFRPLADRLTRWILWMQRDDGSFVHEYDVARARKIDDTVLFYYSGEAALALARMYRLTHDERYARAAERALDWLTDWYDFFLGGFFYGEEHWTCIAADTLWPTVDKPAYQDFCDGYGAFLREQQPAPGELPGWDDLAGAYDEGAPLTAPPNTPAGSRTEAMLSAYALGVHRGDPDPRIRAQILAAAAYLLRQQIRPDNDFAAAGGDVDGGMPESPVGRTVRIDYVQHTGSAMLRAADLLDPPGKAP
jgi:hypothetical protein